MTTPAQTSKVVRDELTTVRTVVAIGPVDGSALGTFGWFLGVRNRRREDTKDRRKYGTCIICRRGLTDDEQIHMVFNVTRNSKTVGNRLCCSPCAEVHATIHTKRAAQVAGG
jgi:hypothetical protein